MTTIQWRPEANSLTTPQSYWPRHIPRAVIGYDELAERIAARNPNYNEGLAKAFMLAMREEIREELLNGNQITLEGAFTCHLSFNQTYATTEMWKILEPPCFFHPEVVNFAPNR